MQSPWTEAEIQTLQKMYRDGASFSAIADQVGRSRVAVAGRARRLGLARTGGTQKHANNSAKRQAKKRWHLNPRPEDCLPPRLPVQTEPAPDGLVGLLDLTATSCRWPFGEPGAPDFGFCGKRKHELGLPYCSKHMARACSKHPKL